MVKNNCYECEHKEFGINYTNCKRKCSYKYKMQRLRSDKNVEEIVGIIYKRVSKSLRDWVAENYQTSKQMNENQQTCEALYDMACDIQRELIKYSSKFDCINNDLIGSYKGKEKRMRKVEIGTSNYTEVFSENAKTFNSYHEYEIRQVSGEGDSPVEVYAKIKFQQGPIKECGVNGCHNEDLIAIVIDRLQGFQESSYKCKENAMAITKLEEALVWLRKRTDDRIKRNVEGTSQL